MSDNAARTVFQYLYLKDEKNPADAVIGFGHFDMKIPWTCGKLYQEGYAPKIILTGGVGAGTADLEKREARAFHDELLRKFPDTPAVDLLVEDQSTNTGENIRFLKEKASDRWPGHNFAVGISRVVLVCNAARQRRTWLTWRKILPGIPALNHPPQTSFEQERELFKSKGRALETLLIGEMDRIIGYPAKDFTVEAEIPGEVYDAYLELKDGK